MVKYSNHAKRIKTRGAYGEKSYESPKIFDVGDTCLISESTLYIKLECS